MAVDNKSVWAMQNSGSNNNGGFYKSDAGTIDYSQQDAAEETFANLSTDVAGTQITDGAAGGLMTAQMVGNGFKIVSDWYEIKTFIDSDTVTIDRSAGSSLSGLAGAIGGAVALPTDTMFETFGPENKVHIKNDGTYVLTGAIIVAKDGAGVTPIEIICHNSSRGDNPTGDDRPLIACGANTFSVDDYWSVFNLRITGTQTYAFGLDRQGIVVNCDFNNSSVTAGRSGLKVGSTTVNTGAQAVDCSATSLNGRGFFLAIAANVYRCVAKGCGLSGFFQGTAAPVAISKSIAYNCTTGIEMDGRFSSKVTLCTIDDCATGIDIENSFNMMVEDCVVSNCTTGVKSTAGRETSHHVDYIHMHNNGTDYVNITAGPNDTSGGPGYVDAANGDFSTGSAVDTVRDFPYAESEDNYKKGAVESAGATGEIAFSSVS